MYERGEFIPDTTSLVWYVLVGASLGLLAATLGRLYSSTLYALHDTKTPFRIAVARVIGGAALALLFAFPLGGCDLSGASLRGARLSAGDIEIIDESYNANPASMRAALSLLGTASPAPDARRIAVLTNAELAIDGTTSTTLRIVQMMFRWESTTPLGLPVLPDV